ncbi:MAG: hypothetical protein AAFQ82_23085, partial [Myxococcota bacterium]
MKRSTILLALVWAALTGCEDTNTVPASQFAGPSGIAIGGAERDLLFVANSAEDAVRVLDVSAGVANSAFVSSPSVFNPLRVPVGP